MGCGASKAAVVEPGAGKPSISGPSPLPSQGDGVVVPFVAGQEGSDSDRSSGARNGRRKMVEACTQTHILGDEVLDCNLLRNASMAWTNDHVDVRTVQPRTMTSAWSNEHMVNVPKGHDHDDVDADAIVKLSPSKRSRPRVDPPTTRELFATKYRLRLEPPNSAEEDSQDDDQTTTCSNASTDCLDHVRDAPPFNVWRTSSLAPGSIEDIEDDHESDAQKLSGDFLHEAFSVATKNTGGGLQRIGNRLVWID